jgi:hypothetical protein
MSPRSNNNQFENYDPNYPSITSGIIATGQLTKQITQTVLDGIHHAGIARLQYTRTIIPRLRKLIFYRSDAGTICTPEQLEQKRQTLISDLSTILTDVSKHHIQLIADAVCNSRTQTITPLTRRGIDIEKKPFFAILFENSIHFLAKAAIHNAIDPLTGKYERICVGKPS